MKSLSSLLLVSLSLGVAAPVAARPRGAAAAQPTAVAAWPTNDYGRPGSVLVFPKWRRGTVSSTDQGTLPVTEFEISVRCPLNPDGTEFDCSTLPGYPNVTLEAHWVCGSAQESFPEYCAEVDFQLHTTVNGTLHFTTEASVTQENGTFTIIPPPNSSCRNEAYLILWVVDASGQAIKFDGLVGDALMRASVSEDAEHKILEAYNAIPIQAGEDLAIGARTDDPANGGNGNGGLDFDGTEYKTVNGVLVGTVRYEGYSYVDAAAKLAALPTGRVFTALTLLTLDVLSNRNNTATFVDLDFYSEDEQIHSTSTAFVCYETVTLARFSGRGNEIDAYLTNINMGRKGLVVSDPAVRQNGPPGSGFTPASVLGLLETREIDDVEGDDRGYMTALYYDGPSVTTTFFPEGAGPVSPVIVAPVRAPSAPAGSPPLVPSVPTPTVPTVPQLP